MMEELVKKESARNTAPSMVESSSKTALVAVKQQKRISADLPTSPCPMNTDFFLVAQLPFYYVSIFLLVVEFSPTIQ
jgi:hypothetical protein